MISGTSKNYFLHVRCPYGDFEDWISLTGQLEPLEQLLAAPFAFECPTHGVQSEFPLDGTEKNPKRAAVPKPAAGRPTLPAKKPLRSSERKAFHVPVFV